MQEHEDALAQRDGEVERLQQHCARLLGVPPEELPPLTAAALPPQQGELVQRLTELEVGWLALSMVKLSASA